MNFSSVLEYLHQRGNELLSLNFNLDTIRVLAADLGHPEKRYPSVLIAGTNGKGSVAATLARILQESGLKTGLYTSPHLMRIEERIRINGEDIRAEDFAIHGTRVIEAGEQLAARGERVALPTYFEIVTALAFHYFAEQTIDLAVLEVGLGGRLDATNIADAECAIITSISFDHQQWLGNTLEQIANEKAGIIKANTPVISMAGGEARSVIRRRCKEVGSPLMEGESLCRFAHVENRGGYYCFDLATPAATYEGIQLNLRGRHQMRNAAAAVLAAEALAARGFPVRSGVIGPAIAHTEWAGRIDVIQNASRLILDGGHNVEAVTALKDFLEENYGSARKVLVFAAMRDKDIDRLGEILFPLMTHVVLTQVDNIRSETSAGIAERCAAVRGDYLMAPFPAEALRLAETLPHDLIIVAGSFYLVGEIYRYLQS